MEKSLMQRMLTQFIICVCFLLVLATPLFYWLTKNFYAEDMIDIVEAVQQGYPLPGLDLEADILHGILIQFVLIVLILGLAIVVMIAFISKRLWASFDQTLGIVESFKLENGVVPTIPNSRIKEFNRLNTVLNRLMTNNLRSYQMQKEFTENASHELQTPLAVFRSKLDLLLQQPDITDRQSKIIQDLYQISGRISRLSRNLLLLAKMENNQYNKSEKIDVVDVLKGLRPYLESLSGELVIKWEMQGTPLWIEANSALLESLINNLVVNAIRHNKKGGVIILRIEDKELKIINTSDEEALDATRIFQRFYHSSSNMKGYGLGLAIVKAICDYHGWSISYSYHEGLHTFSVSFC